MTAFSIVSLFVVWISACLLAGFFLELPDLTDSHLDSKKVGQGVKGWLVASAYLGGTIGVIAALIGAIFLTAVILV